MEARNYPLAKIILERSYLEDKEDGFLLASGKRSQFYFDCQKTTCRAEAMPLIGRAFITAFLAGGEVPEAVGGLTRGADPIAQSIAYASLESGHLINMFSVRKERKDHGTSQWIEGYAARGTRVAIVDDVVTSGGSVIQAIDQCLKEGLEIVQAVVLVDREEGGLDNIRRRLRGVPVSTVFSKSELDILRGDES